MDMSIYGFLYDSWNKSQLLFLKKQQSTCICTGDEVFSIRQGMSPKILYISYLDG
jgi:hypothetical protein